jgi:hypothetical protein
MSGDEEEEMRVCRLPAECKITVHRGKRGLFSVGWLLDKARSNRNVS